MANINGFVYLDEVAEISWDAKYATDDNLTGKPLNGYNANRVVGSEELGARLKLAADYFKSLGYGVLVYDAYRPCRAVQSFVEWAKRDEDNLTKANHYPNIDKRDLFKLGYIAERSGHSRGSSIDLTLTRDGKEIDMGGIFDFMDEISHHGYPVNEAAARNRGILMDGMCRFGFKPYSDEWWHYSLINEPYPDTYFDFTIDFQL